MASPQTKNGYTRVANELLEAILGFPFTAAQLRFVLWILRESYGWRRNWTKVTSMREINEATKIPKASVAWAITVLLRAGVIQKEGPENSPARYKLNKNFDTWMIQAADRLPLLPSNPLDAPSNPLDEKDGKSSNPLDAPSNPLDKTVQPIGRPYKELKKERKVKKGTGAKVRAFTPPTIEEVQSYCLERNNGVNPQKWRDHYESNGWKVGRNPMKDWKAAIRTWEGNQFGENTPSKPAAPVKRCRCNLDGSEYRPSVLSRDGKTPICKPCRQHEDIEAGVL